MLEAKGPGSHAGEPGGAAADDTVAIVGLDGYARAKATFAPRRLPAIGNAAPLLQPEARVAAGAVYYVDGAGVVRRLAVGSAPSQVAVFPITGPQQELSFAVSPDGRSLVASRLQLPGVVAPSTGGGPFPELDPTVHWTQALLRADAGGATVQVWSRDLGTGQTAMTQLISVVGWDSVAPLAVIQADLGTQQSTMGRLLNGGHLSRLDSMGEASTPLGGPDCNPWAERPDGAVLCVLSDLTHPAVRRPDGAVTWTPPAGCQYPVGSFALSPDGRFVTCAAGQQMAVFGEDGSVHGLPGSFLPQGWLDQSTLIGDLGNGGGDLATYRLGASSYQDLGFKGVYVGKVSG